MPKAHKPRSGSMQYWPRKRAKRVRIRYWANEKGILGFAGYKAGMTHIQAVDNRKNSLTKGEDIFIPTTIIECPPLKAASIIFYKNSKIISQVCAENLDKELERKAKLVKKKKIEDVKDYDDLRILAYTQPKLINLKKKPDLFELAIGGNKEEKLNLAKEVLGKELRIKDVFKEGQQIDIHSVTKGKGFQGPVKRFGVSLRQHKSEKVTRGPGSLGAWNAQGKIMYRVAHAGKMGYHLRTEYNKWILKISEKPEEINPKGGFIRYGVIKSDYILLKGSVPGSFKRLIRLNQAIRKNKKIPIEAPAIEYISLASKQGN